MTVSSIAANICVALGLAVAAASCGGCATREGRLVSRRGAADAMALVERAPAMSRMQLEDFLLRVRANEQEYRAAGRPEVADAYIATFETTLAQRSDSLAALILGPQLAAARKADPLNALLPTAPIDSAPPSAPPSAPAPADSAPAPAAAPASEPPAINEISPWEVEIK